MVMVALIWLALQAAAFASPCKIGGEAMCGVTDSDLELQEVVAGGTALLQRHGKPADKLADEDVLDYHHDTPTGKFGKLDDRANQMSSEEAHKLDEEAAKLEPEYFLNLASVLYPSERDEADKNIASSIKDLKRDAKITLQDGTTIPYWQTKQYGDRHFRLFFTRFREENDKGKKLDKISQAERARLWAIAGVSHKNMMSDAFKDCVLARTNIPATMVGVGKKSLGRGTPLSAEIFYEHLEHVYRGSYVQVSRTKGAAAFANGPGINFNSKNVKILDRKLAIFVGLYAHEASHNMGYNHPDKIPGAMETCTRKTFKNTFQVYDLTLFPGFTVAA